MLRKLFGVNLAVLLFAGTGSAGPQDPAGAPGGKRDQNRDETCVNGTTVSPEDIVTLTGMIEPTDIGAGLKVPSFTLTQDDDGTPATVVMGPYYIPRRRVELAQDLK